MNIALRTITRDNFYAICQLEVAPHQTSHIDSNAISLAEANFMASPWYRAIYVKEQPIGFILVNVDSQSNRFSLWRFMLDKNYQKKGFGRQAIALLYQELRQEFGIIELFTSVVIDEKGPKRFYLSCGFIETGTLVDGREIELVFSLDSN
ncbi:GNAT family N-acetyltransferase [Vibrio barjaei]|uniref:GNAT family N-acetyltransferase n=1 Tax=Vibrio barjaei TaxID=1676683 RepID=UPI0007BB90C1|nr:GNAT family N-acetyltransferase [Vibrio barjaei]OIN24028.1 GNAT family N-acetyltransferase [Vibrio barjaei]